MQKFDDKLFGKLENVARERGFSGVISLSQRNEVLFEQAYGLADRSNKVPNRVNTRFGIASGTKFFTALAIGTLLQQEKLNLDDRLQDVVPIRFPNFSPAITVRQLLTHTSGVFDYYDEEADLDFDNFFVDIPWYHLQTPSDYVPLFQNEGMKFEPGKRFSYSNGGYILLGIIIESLTAVRYRDYVTETIFKPTGMINSGYFAMNRLPNRTAWGYIDEPDGEWRTNIYNLPIIGASDGGAFTTAQDMRSLWYHFIDGELLRPDWVTAFTTPQTKIKNDRYYGYGLYVWQRSTAPIYYLVGMDAGVDFYSAYLPGVEAIFTVLSNTSADTSIINRTFYDWLKVNI